MAKLGVIGQDSQILFEGLGDEEAVEGITVLRGQRLKPEKVLDANRQYIYSAFAEHRDDVTDGGAYGG